MSEFGPNSRIDAFVKRWLEDTSSMVECHLYVDEGWTYHESNYVTQLYTIITKHEKRENSSVLCTV